MCRSLIARARDVDIFGAPVGVTYKTRSNYQTTLGGCVTIAFLIFLGGNIILNCLSVLVKPEYNSQTNVKYNLFSEGNVHLNISTVNQTLAGMISQYDSDAEESAVDDYFRVMFYLRKMTEGKDTVELVWLNTTRCIDFYS